MSRKRPGLSGLEWEVMEAVWNLGGRRSVREVLESAYGGGEKAYTTVQTVMNNLVRKGYLKKKTTGMVCFYSPKVPRRDAVPAEIRKVAEKVFDGSFKAMASYLIRSDSLDEAEIAELKRFIEERERKAKGGKK